MDANGARSFIGHFLCGVETVKRFVNVRLRCNVSNLNKVSKMSTLPPWKNFCECFAEAKTEIKSDFQVHKAFKAQMD